MNNQPDPASHLRAVGIAVAITTAASLPTDDLSIKELIGDADPLAVVSVLSTALNATLSIVLGDTGRQSVLQHLALGAAQEGTR